MTAGHNRCKSADGGPMLEQPACVRACLLLVLSNCIRKLTVGVELCLSAGLNAAWEQDCHVMPDSHWCRLSTLD